MTNLFYDTEVKGPYKGALRELAIDGYARHPSTRILLESYAIDDGPETVVDCAHGERRPLDLQEAWDDPHVTIVAHNAQFDRVVTMHKWLSVPHIDRWYCTKSRAYTVGLPGDLATLCSIFNLDATESKLDGKKFIELFCERGADPDQHLVEWLKFMDYSRGDITALRRLYHLLPAWGYTAHEQRLYHLDQQINDRGFRVDLDLARRIIQMSELAQVGLNAQVAEISGGTIDKGTQCERIKDFIGTVPDMRAETLRKTLRSDKSAFTPAQIKMIELRLLSSKSSIAKCKTAITTAVGERIRYTTNFHGAGRIGRWTHKGFQPGNMPRPTMEPEEIEEAISVLQLGGDVAYSIYGDRSLEVGANAIRGLIVAAPGHKLVAGDYSNIEGRKLAWYAGEEWKLQAYRAGLDMYRLVGSRMTGRDPDSFTKDERQGFKGCELSMGYEGGVGAYVNVANAYKVDLVKLASEAPAILGTDLMDRGRKSWEWAVRRRETEGLPQPVYIACAAYKFAWRDACQQTVDLWAQLIDAAKSAVRVPGRVFEVSRVKLVSSAGWLAIKIPSGRAIMFAKPKITWERQFEYDENGEKTKELEPRETLSALKAPTWRRESLYGGLVANAITQGGCRDILADGLLRVDDAGWPVVLHVHDEIVAELPDSDPRDHTHLEALLAQMPEWCADLPMEVKGFTAKRYHK